MIKIAHAKEVGNFKLPQEVVYVTKEIAAILDEEYGINREVDSDFGGYIVVIEANEDFEKLKEIYIEIDEVIPEYVDRVTVVDGEDWINSLIILSSDYTVSILSKISITPQNLINYMK